MAFAQHFKGRLGKVDSKVDVDFQGFRNLQSQRKNDRLWGMPGVVGLGGGVVQDAWPMFCVVGC